MRTFIPGLELSALFYREAVKPIVVRRFPVLQYAAALIGQGSEVLGFDTERSTDHAWGPRLMLFLPERDLDTYEVEIDRALRDELPYHFRGYPTSFTQPDEEKTVLMRETASGPVNHNVVIASVPDFVHDRLGIASYPGLGVTDWLQCTGQALLEVTAGAVYHDGFGEIMAIRRRLHYYPHDVWLYLLAAQWARLAQLEPFVARCGDVATEPLSTEVRHFHDRPYLVIAGERFSRAIRERIMDEDVRRLPEDIGSVEQCVDSTDVLSVSEMRARLRAMYSRN